MLQSTSTLSEVVNQAIGTQFPEVNDATVAAAILLGCLGVDFERVFRPRRTSKSLREGLQVRTAVSVTGHWEPRRRY